MEVQTVTDHELKRIYKRWPEVRNLLRGMGCERSRAEDIFQEALIILCRKTAEPDFHLDTDPFFYVLKTCKFLWYNQARKLQKESKREISEPLPEPEEEEWLQRETRLAQMEKAIRKLGDQCRKLLHFFYACSMNMVDIARKLDLRNDKVAKAQKYRCLQKAKELVIESTANEEWN